MGSGKRVLSGKRMLAGILTAVMVISSVQLPGGIVWAEELSENGIVTDDGINTVGENQEGDASGLTGEGQSGSQTAPDEPNDGTSESGETEGTAPDGGETTPDDGAVSGDDNTSDGENASGDGNATDGENVSGDDSISDGDDASDDDNTSGGEEASDDENTSDDENAPEEAEEDTESPEDGLLYPAGISENDLAETEQSEEMIEGEIEGAYQFGGAPAKQGNLSVYADSAYAEGAEEYLYEQMLERNERISLSSYNIPYDDSGKKTLNSLVSGVLNEHPELYFVKSGYSYWNNGTIITAIDITYNNTLDDAAVQRGIREAIATVDANMSDLEKAIVLHDYLTVNCEYDKERLEAGGVPNESHTIYGVFADRIAVCDGYALAYKYLLKEVGIDCYMVTSDEINHAWNMIVLDGEYYQVDVTWDDPTWDMIGRSVHTYMFRSDAGFDPVDAQQKHTGGRVTYGSQTVDYKATDTRYDNAFWTACRSPLVFADDACYYVTFDSSAGGGVVKKTSLTNITDSGTTVQSIDQWTVWGSSNRFYTNAYSGLFRIGDRLYYNDKSSIYSMAMDGTDKRPEFTADTTDGYIYGSAYCQGRVLYTLRQTPNISAKETVLAADMTVEGSSPVDVPVQRIELSAYTLELEAGEEAELTAKVYPTYATDTTVLWTSDNEAVAVVSDGSVRAVSAGSCTITATAGDKKAECSITVTAKGDNGALDLDNLSHTYTALDDTQISSTADGKPKLLIFYSNTCPNCQSTIKSISSKIADFANIDIYAMETNNGTKEAVAEFQSQYGCEEIIFSYDVDRTNARSMTWYANAGGMGTDIAWPLICYIDANNRLQYMTMSRTTADEVLSNLKEYCNAAVEAPQSYKITYILNGGTNSPYNPSTYTAETDTFILWNAERDGYRFEGWYQDAAYTQKVMQIIKGSTGNITLYAKWSPVQTGNLPEIDMTPAEGNVVMGFSGSYYTETADKILSRLNAIRLEACKEGVINPFTGEPLTEADYVALKWSSDLEAIARLRAAEAAVNNDHTRLNGTDCFTVRTTNGEQSWAENLAWNNDGLMKGIEQWYGEKGDWVNQTAGKVTGHYTSIINPGYTYVGLGTFRLSTGGWYSVAQEFSYKNSMDEHKDDSQGACVQYMEVTGSAVKSLAFDKSNVKSVTAGETARLALNVTVTYKDYDGTSKDYSGAYQAGGSWRSSDETVAVVDQTGMVTAKARGTVRITVSAGSKSAEATITVDGATEPDTELGRNTDISVKGKEFIYNGAALEPVIVVTDANTVLTEGQDYTLSYLNNRNVGTATVIVTGAGRYYGSAAATFEITPAMLEVRAKDRAILIGDPLPAVHAYEYEVAGLMADDTLLTEPSFTCGITDTTAAGRYDIIPSGADAGNNYVISYQNGRLTVASEYVACMVTFDVQGHGMAPAAMIDVRVGSMINKPDDPAAEGYRFDGWYMDRACTNAWDFETDIVQSDMTLYAKWLDASAGGGFLFQEIADVYYTGNQCRPAVTIYDGEKLLKAGKDYQVKYCNNINVNDKRRKGTGAGEDFDETLPYVVITGRGSYTDVVKINFNILKASIGNGGEDPTDGVTLKVTDQLETASKTLKPFTSIKYAKSMRQGKDYTLRLTVVDAIDQSGRKLETGMELRDAEIPAGYSGEFLLEINGIDNYEGTIRKKIQVADKEHLIKNVTITLGKNQKTVTYAGKPVQLNASEVNSADTFTVKYKTTFLKPGRDYTVSYRNHDRVGKAELVITGAGEYAGSKTAAFTIKGVAFSAKTVKIEGVENKVYTGRAQTQNDAVLTYDMGSAEWRTLQYGTDYTISYSKNIDKGTATMIFTGSEKNGYSGSVKKTFKIAAADITQVRQTEATRNLSFNYTKAGVKPVEEIVLTNQVGIVLNKGKDYILKYVNNTAVASADDANPPMVIVMGKGNYAGQLEIPFHIVKADLRGDSIQVKTLPLTYKKDKKDTYVYKPVVRLMDGKLTLRAGRDYEIEYLNNTQADYENYMQKLQNQSATESDMPRAVITGKSDAAYELKDPIVVPLPIYRTKLKKADLTIEIDDAVYTGVRITPAVKVYYGKDRVQLVEGRDYTISYGANDKSGRNRGSVTVSGITPYYSGNVRAKFDIVRKPIIY